MFIFFVCNLQIIFLKQVLLPFFLSGLSQFFSPDQLTASAAIKKLLFPSRLVALPSPSLSPRATRWAPFVLQDSRTERWRAITTECQHTRKLRISINEPVWGRAREVDCRLLIKYVKYARELARNNGGEITAKFASSRTLYCFLFLVGELLSSRHTENHACVRNTIQLLFRPTDLVELEDLLLVGFS